MKRLFENIESGEILELDSDEITKKYNSYGYFYELSDLNFSVTEAEKREKGWFIQSYQEDKDDYLNQQAMEAWEENNEVDYVFIEVGDLLITSKKAFDSFLFFANLEEETGDDLVEGGFFYQPYDDFEKIDIEEDDEAVEVYSYWDGSNWKELWLVSDYYPTSYQEVTEDYPEWEKKEEFASDNYNFGHSNYFWYQDDEKKGIIIYVSSYWQGDLSTYQFHEYGTDEFFYYAMKKLEDLCRDIEGIEEEVKKDIINYHAPELQAGEQLLFDDYELAFTYRDEIYHFDFHQISESEAIPDPTYPDILRLDFDDAVIKGRKQIQKRRDERLAELQDISNHYPLERIYVERQDSLAAGNCIPHTDAFIEELRGNGFEEDAMRADKLLTLRNDNFTRRAVIQAYRNGHIH